MFTHNDVIMAGGSQRSIGSTGVRSGGVKKRKLRPFPVRPPRRDTSMQTDPLTTPGVITAPGKMFGPLGKSFKTTLRVAYTVTMDPTTGSTADAIFSANGIAKPFVSDITNVAQCYGHDQLVPFFDHYTVIGSKCRVTSVNNTNVPLYLGCAIRDRSNPITEANHLLRSSPGTSMSLMAQDGSGDCLKSVQQTFSPNRFFGKSKGNVVGEDNLRGQMNLVASTVDMPEEQAYYHCLISAQTPTDNPPAQTIQVEIEYTVVLTEPKAMANRE